MNSWTIIFLMKSTPSQVLGDGRKALSSPISCSCVRDKADAAFLLCSAPHDERCSLSQYSMRARKNFSYLALLSLQSAPIPRKGKRPSLNLGDDTNFFAQFECAPLICASYGEVSSCDMIAGPASAPSCSRRASIHAPSWSAN
jgi:hypothetical protein